MGVKTEAPHTHIWLMGSSDHNSPHHWEPHAKAVRPSRRLLRTAGSPTSTLHGYQYCQASRSGLAVINRTLTARRWYVCKALTQVGTALLKHPKRRGSPGEPILGHGILTAILLSVQSRLVSIVNCFRTQFSSWAEGGSKTRVVESN